MRHSYPPDWHSKPKVRCRICGRRLITINYFHLQLHPTLDPQHPMEDYKHCFGLKYAISRYTRRSMHRGQKRRYMQLGRAWSAGRVVREIRALRRSGQPLNAKHVHRTRGDLYGAGRTYFGAWSAAVSAAGLDYRSVRLVTVWTRELVIERIRLLKQNGLRLNPEALEGKRDNELLRQGRALFGTWARALEATGLDPRQEYIHIRRSSESVLEAIRERAGEGRSLRPIDVHREDSGLYYGAQAAFGGWRAAVRAAGHDYDVRPAPRTWTDDAILSVLRERAPAGKRLAVRDMPDGLRGAVRRRYGSWEAACQAAGVPYSPLKRPRWTPATLTRALTDFARRHGDLNTTALKQHDPTLLSTMYQHFGSLQSARERVESLLRNTSVWTRATRRGAR